MALVRCNNHKPRGRKEPYVEAVKPLGYPESSTICGRADCLEAGLVWVTESERNAWMEGQTIFWLRTHTAKIGTEPYPGR